jgi:hypothetical protein
MGKKRFVRFDQLAGFVSVAEGGRFVIHVTRECNVSYELGKSYALVPKNERSMVETIAHIFEMGSIIPNSVFQGGRVYKMHPVEYE